MPKIGLKPIKQVHLYTKWRAVVHHPYKDVLCPLPSNEIIQLVLKRKGTPSDEQQDEMTPEYLAIPAADKAVNECPGKEDTCVPTPKHKTSKRKGWSRTMEVNG